MRLSIYVKRVRERSIHIRTEMMVGRPEVKEHLRTLWLKWEDNM